MNGLASLPRIVQFLPTEDALGSSCPHCGATGRFIHRFRVADGRELGAMSGCVKLFPVSPVADADHRLSEKERLAAKQGRKPASWDVDKRKAIDDFYAGIITEVDCLRVCKLADSRARTWRTGRFR